MTIIGCLQFAPQTGDVQNNLNRADAVLSKADPQDLDLLVLPELAFTGHNFKSLHHISPFLEPTAAGITSLWARTTALKYECMVTVGYPERVEEPKEFSSPEYYNSAITVNAEGETIANYRKSILYCADDTRAEFFDWTTRGLGNVAMGILIPKPKRLPWKNGWVFACRILDKQANLVILSMAWRTCEEGRSYSRFPNDPDLDILSYWLALMEPLIRAETEGEIICVFANRTGTEDEAVYAGTSAVLGIQAGEVKVYGVLGRGEKELLIVDTNSPPQEMLVYTTSPEVNESMNIPTNADTVAASSISLVDVNSQQLFSTKDDSPTIPQASLPILQKTSSETSHIIESSVSVTVTGDNSPWVGSPKQPKSPEHQSPSQQPPLDLSAFDLTKESPQVDSPKQQKSPEPRSTQTQQQPSDLPAHGSAEPITRPRALMLQNLGEIEPEGIAHGVHVAGEGRTAFGDRIEHDEIEIPNPTTTVSQIQTDSTNASKTVEIDTNYSSLHDQIGPESATTEFSDINASPIDVFVGER